MARPSKSSIFAKVRAEIAGLFGIDPDTAALPERLKIDHATALKLEIERLQTEQMGGDAVDIRRLAEAHGELKRDGIKFDSLNF
ncbi:hypothetical protein [Bradyrhizobium sp. UFLA05-112]